MNGSLIIMLNYVLMMRDHNRYNICKCTRTIKILQLLYLLQEQDTTL